MAQKSLVAENIDAGRRLVQHLDAAGFEVVAALWLFDPHDDVYHFYVASPAYQRLGPKAAYTALHTAAGSLLPLVGLTLDDVSVIPSSDFRVAHLARLFRTPPGAVVNIRATNNMIGSYVIEDALIYRMSP